ncbi:phage major capsid protein [Prescottella equi]|uniref:phage major capsid protein n=1 Tax=Rhodococcus hoagii TaxID=43767 RepID=UPI000A10B18F|nr:phage major capsid protein [Prescottella equi]ORM00690.1 hypothetical protein A5N69_07040 [Prescottella equi]ORM21569.1 hypothetical protein A5N74_01655 [Prescottella equi]
MKNEKRTPIYELERRKSELETTIRDILTRNTGQDITGRDADVFDETTTELEAVRTELEESRARLADFGDKIRSGDYAFERGYDSAPVFRKHGDNDPRAAVRDEALRKVEALHTRGDLGDGSAAFSEQLVRKDPNAREFVAATADPDYESAFTKYVADPQRGHLTWTPEEQRAFQRVHHAASVGEQRGLLESNSGGLVVPFQLDPSIMLTNGGSVNPLRQISRVVTTASNQWAGITSAGVSAEWTAEAVEWSEVNPVLAQPSIPVFKADAYTTFSYELEMDAAASLLADLQMLFADAKDQLEAAAFLTGTGTGQPEGLITGLAAAGGSTVMNLAGEALEAADAYTLQNSLPPRWQPNAKWAGNLATLNTFRQFQTTNGSLSFPDLQTNPPQLLGRPFYEVSGMDSTINPAVTENNYVLVYGDFSNFVVVDRIGAVVEVIPHVFGPNRRPTGQRGLAMWWRTGSKVVVPGAFRVGNVNTTA